MARLVRRRSDGAPAIYRVEGIIGFRVLGLGGYRDNRKENGSYCNSIGYVLGLYGV